MTHKLKTLGLALVAVFAMSAVASSVASATTTSPSLFTFNVGANELASIDAEQIGVGTLTINGLAITCGTVTGKGNPVKTKAAEPDVVEGTTKGPESTDVTLTGLFGPNNCHVVVAGLTKTITVTENGCAGILDAKTTVTGGVTSNSGLFTIECPAGKKVEVHMYSTAATEVGTTCTYDIEAIAANTTRPGIVLTNKVNTPGSANDIVGDGNLQLTVNNTIKSAVCGQNATETLLAHGQSTVRATNEKGEFVDTSVSS